MPHATEEQTTSDDGIKHTLFVSDDDVCAPAAGGSCLGIRITDETYLSFDHAGPDFVSDGSVVTIIYAGDADIYAVGADTVSVFSTPRYFPHKC